mgnify:CR=1 FL=1
MCSIKAPKPEPIKIDKPQYLHNPYLDDARNGGASADALRTGRSALRIPLDTGLGIGFQGRGGSQGTSLTAGPRGNGRNPGGGTTTLPRINIVPGSNPGGSGPPGGRVRGGNTNLQIR